MQCMKFLRSNLQNPSQNFCKNLFDFEKPQNFQKSQKLRLKIMKCMNMRDLDTYQVKKTWLRSKNPWGRGLRWKREVLGGEKAREIERYRAKWVCDCERPLYSTSIILNRLRGVKDLSSFKEFDRSSYRVGVQGKRSSIDWGSCRGAIKGIESFSIDPPSYREVSRLW